MSAQLLFWISLPAVGLANQRFIESASVNNRVVRWDSKTECSDPIGGSEMSIRPGGWIVMKSAQRRKDEPKAGHGIGMLSLSTAVCVFGFRSVLRLEIAAFCGEGSVCLLRMRYYFVSAIFERCRWRSVRFKNLLWICGDLKESLADENRFYCVGRSCRKEFYIRKRKIN